MHKRFLAQKSICDELMNFCMNKQIGEKIEICEKICEKSIDTKINLSYYIFVMIIKIKLL